MINAKSLHKPLTIKNYCPPAIPSPDAIEATYWQPLSKALSAIQSDSELPTHMEELYRCCESLCHHGCSASTHAKLVAFLQEYNAKLKSRLYERASLSLSPCSSSPPSDPNAWLSFLNETWQDYRRKLNVIRNIFIYLDRSFLHPTASLSSLWEMGLDLFKMIAFSDAIQKKTLDSLLVLIQQERDEEIIDRSLVQHIVNLWLSLSLYREAFHPQLIAETAKYYNALGNTWIQKLSIVDYLKHVESRLSQELERSQHLVHATSQRELVETLERVLIAQHASDILASGFESMMKQNQTDDLKRLYRLLSRINGLDLLKSHFGSYIKNTGSALVLDPARELTIVSDLLAFKIRLDAILQHCFENYEGLVHALKESFESFMNMKHAKSAEWIAKYLDWLLKTGSSGRLPGESQGPSQETDEPMDVEAMIDRLLIIFRYIQGKDIFEAFYKKDLSKRLLLGKSNSLDLEKSVLSKLKIECGPAFTSKLEGMFKDMELSREIQAAFKLTPKYASADSERGLDLQVSVLTAGFWPTYPNQPEIVLPAPIAKLQEAFTKFYMKKHSGRRLQWNHNLEHCIVKAHFPKGDKELSVSLYQALVLNLFSNPKIASLTVAQIRLMTKLDQQELEKIILSLTVGKYAILVKEPSASKHLGDSDTLAVNADFSAKLYRLHINTVQLKETPEEIESTTEQVVQDRQYQVDAAIVRIMKCAKTLSSTLLLSELFSALKFPIKAADLKKRIDSLVDRDYLELDKDNPNVYNYLA